MADDDDLGTGTGVSTAERHASPAAAASPPDKLPPYDAVRSALHEAAMDKKKPSSSKVALLLRALLYYKLDSDLAEVLLQLLERYVVGEKDDEKRRQVLHYLHYLLTELAPPEPRPLTGVRDTLNKETRVGVPLNRRLPALRSYGLWAEGNVWQEALSEALGKLELEAEGKKKEKGGLFSLGGSKRDWTDAHERADLQATLLSAARARPRRAPLQRAPLLDALHSDDALAMRHAAALLLLNAPEEASAVAPMLRPLIPHLRQKEAVCLSDELARVYWTRLCGVLSHTDGEPGADFGQAVLQSLLDVSDRVFLEAVAVLRLTPARLPDATVLLAAPDGRDTRAPALRELHVRLADLLVAPAAPPALVHAACRSLAALAEAFAPLPDVAAYTHLAQHPLFPALAHIAHVAARAAPHVRLRALKAALWLPTRHAAAEVEALLVAEFRRPAPLPPRLFTELFKELLRRLTATPWVYSFVLRLLAALHAARPDLLAHVPLPDLWRAVVAVGEPARAAALAALWAMLDAPPAPQHRLAVLRVHLRIHAFLGAHSVALTAAAPAPPLPGLSAALHALLLRLEIAAVQGAPETAAVAVEALLQVALAHGADVRLRVFQFLATCRRHTALLQPAVTQALHVLDRLLCAAPPPDLPALAALLGPDVRLAV